MLNLSSSDCDPRRTSTTSHAIVEMWSDREMEASMKCLRIYAIADGESHFGEVEIPTSPRHVHPDAAAFEVSRIMRRHASVSRAFRRVRDRLIGIRCRSGCSR